MVPAGSSCIVRQDWSLNEYRVCSPLSTGLCTKLQLVAECVPVHMLHHVTTGTAIPQNGGSCNINVLTAKPRDTTHCSENVRQMLFRTELWPYCKHNTLYIIAISIDVKFLNFRVCGLTCPMSYELNSACDGLCSSAYLLTNSYPCTEWCTHVISWY